MLKSLKNKNGNKKINTALELSICIPTYCGGQEVVSCIKNVLSYKGQNIEVVVYDNASEDDTVKRIKEIDDNRLKIYVNEKNVGPFHNWYNVLKKGNGRYVMLLQDNDELVVKNLPLFLQFLKTSEYDIIKNAYFNREHISGEVTVAKMQYYGKILSHASFLVYKREAFQDFIPLEKSFDYTFCAYPYFIWDTQILKKYPVNAKKCYINGKIEIVRIKEKKSKSRTRAFLDSSVPPSYTFDNAVYMFNKNIDFLKSLYMDDKDFSVMSCNLYRGDLMLGTLWFYEHMVDDELRKRYQVRAANANEIDYLELNHVFLEYAKKRIEIQSHLKKIQSDWKLAVITKRNTLLFKLEHVYKRDFRNRNYFLGCIKNRFLTYLVNIIT